MELTRLIESLSDAAAYPCAAGSVEVRHTHISVVFLAGAFAYKVKKPVDLGFLDFSTLARRRHFCEEEVRLNRRLAPGVYLGVVPVSRAGPGVKVEAPGEPVEWAVKMKRLPEEATLRERLRRGLVGAGVLESLAGRIAASHAEADAGPLVSEFGRFEVVARNARENLDHVAPRVGAALSRSDLDRLRQQTEDALARLRPLIDSRARRGVPRDTHGDLRLEHVYLFPESPPPADLVIIDCIEFNERFRFADPVSDMAFLVMDLMSDGRTDLARAFAEGYFRASGDEEGRCLLPFYVAYRAAVRGKVEVFELSDQVIPEAERAAALGRARAHWLLALAQLERTGRGP
jgi:aminoglycoside phosphotransferase family enzyme